MKILYTYIKKYWPIILFTLFLAAVNQVFSLLDPLIFRYIIDNYVTKYQEHTAEGFYRGVGLLLLAAVGVAFISRVAKNFQDYFVNVITQRLGADMYTDGLAHSLKLPYLTFEDQRSGETLGILQKVRTDVERLISASVNVIFMTLVGVIFVMIYAFSVHWLIAPVYFSTIPLLGWLSSILGKRIKAIQQKIVKDTASLAGSTTESLRNIELVKSLGLADQEIKRLNSITGKILKLELNKVKYLRSLSFIQGTSVNFLRTLILGLMLYLIFAQQITFGEFFSLWIYSFFIFGPLQELGNVLNIYRESQASLVNFQSVMKMPVEENPISPVKIASIDSLEFKNISFKYNSASSMALTEISFKASRGETVAFAGPSGSGKSTLVKLLVGLYQPGSGEILFSGHSHSTIALDDIRERIGFVTQDTQLFAGTIRENLLFVNPDASDAMCYDVLRKASCKNILYRSDNGLDTLIGEGGIKVSGGEKQRLSIARALLRCPDILVFDEATSSLDSLTEEEITKTIRRLSRRVDNITLMIAHRLSTIMHADRISVLERGKIIESGSHEFLLELKGLYYAMWRQQIGERKETSSD